MHAGNRLQASDEQSAHEWAQLVNKQVEQIKVSPRLRVPASSCVLLVTDG